jgi:hypothetical protein
MIKEKVKRSLQDFPQLNEAGKAIHVALNNIKQFFGQSMQNQLETEANARQLTFALGRTLAGALLVEQAAVDSIRQIEGAEEDVIVANRWCLSREFTQPLIPTNSAIISEEARIVFGSNAKI